MKKFLVMATTLVAGFSIGVAHAEEGKGKGKGGDPVKRAEGMIKSLDKDGNGTLSKEEFASSPYAAKMKEKNGEGSVDKAFAARDTNKDGQLDKAELSAPPKGKGDKGKGKEEGKGDKGGKKAEGEVKAGAKAEDKAKI